MGRNRKQLQKVLHGSKWTVIFRHPMRGVVRFDLGGDALSAEQDVIWLNQIFLEPGNWAKPPLSIPKPIRDLWLGTGSGVKPPRHGEELAAALKAGTLAKLWEERYHAEKRRRDRAEKTIAVIHKQRVREGPSPQLGKARDEWLKNYKADSHHHYNVKRELQRFVEHFGDEREVDTFIGRELQIKNYLDGLSVGPGRRNQIRLMVLRLLEDAGAIVDRKKVRAASAAAVRARRGPIRWLERPQAVALASKLPEYWSDLFRVNLGLGLRPDEMPTLRRSNFSQDLSVVTLQPLGHLTLKTGSRKINVPGLVQEIVRRRLEAGEIVFPQVSYREHPNNPKPPKIKKPEDRGQKTEGGRPWKTVEWFDRKYLRELRAAKDAVNGDETLPVAAKINIELDARVARRTCGSLMLRGGRSVDDVAAVLGDNPKTVREHYARIISCEVDPSAAAI